MTTDLDTVIIGDADEETTSFAISIPNPSRPAQETALQHFSLLVGTPPKETNLVIENVKLAEDRIPSYAIVLYGDNSNYTTWVDGAIFYFQAETTLEFFLKQRRRWTNGALFSYVFLVFIQTNILCGSKLSALRKVIIWLMFAMQLLSYVLTMISPAIFGSGLYLGLISLFEGGGQPIIIAVTVFYFLYFFAFVWTHRYRVFVKPLFFIMMFLNIMVIIFVLCGFLRQSISWGFNPEGIDRKLLQYITLAVMAVPFAMALIALDFRSLWMLIKGAIPFWLFLPTLIGSFSLYAIARVCDTTWGNRVSTAGSNFKGATQKELDDLQTDLSNNALVGLIFVTVANGIIEALVIYYGYNSWFIIGVLCVVFFVAVVQICISTCYFVGKHLSGLTCWQRCGCCRCCFRLDYVSEARKRKKRRESASRLNTPRSHSSEISPRSFEITK